MAAGADLAVDLEAALQLRIVKGAEWAREGPCIAWRNLDHTRGKRVAGKKAKGDGHCRHLGHECQNWFHLDSP